MAAEREVGLAVIVKGELTVRAAELEVTEPELLVTKTL
jgi:hypothetical protein